MVFGKCDNNLDAHRGKRNIVRQMAKNH